MVNLNGRLVNELPDGLMLAQRGLYYGDALFESIRVFGGRVPLMERHWDRLVHGMELMDYRIPADWSAAFWANEILRMAPPDARVRLTVWRAPGGLYLPENDDPLFLITATGLETGVFEWPSAGVQVGLCGSVRLPVDALSGLKTLNAARYVAAAKEAQARGWDDAILLNAYERVCEATSSNVFWFEGERLFTPPLSDGCVTGVMRDLLLALTRAAGLETAEMPAPFERLMAADEVFLSNAVRGIRPVHSCEGKVFSQVQTRRLFELMVGYFC